MRSAFAATLGVLLHGMLIGCAGENDTDQSRSVSGQARAVDGPRATPTGSGIDSPEGSRVRNAHGLASRDLSYITSDFFAAVVLRPRQIAQSPMLSPLLRDELLTDQVRQMGFDPFDLEQLILLFPAPTAAGQPPGTTEAVSAIGRFAEATNGRQLLREVRSNVMAHVEGDLLEETYAGKTYYKLHADVPFAAYLPDDRTIVAADEATLLKMLSADQPNGPLIERLRGVNPDHDAVVVMALEPVRWMIADSFSALRAQIPPSWSALTTLPEHIKAATMTVSLAADTPVGVLLECHDVPSAVKAEELVRQGHQLAQTMFAVWRQQIPRDAQREANPAVELAEEVLAGICVTRNASQVVLTLERPRQLADLLPRIAAQLAVAVRQTIRQEQRKRPLEQLALAMLLYHQSRGEFPPAALRGTGGRPLLSWRVALLPYLGKHEQALYGSLRLDEPWDSPQNLKALRYMPEVFRSLERPNDGTTSIMLIVGPETPFAGDHRPRLAEITDGLPDTIMFVEAGADKAVPWTRPADLPFIPANPAAALGETPPSFMAAFFDASVHAVSTRTEVETLRRLIRPRDGHPVTAAKSAARY